MHAARFNHTATLLPNGKVLIVGGHSGRDRLSAIALNTAEIYDPATGLFSYTGNMNFARAYHTATLLGNGDVLIAGGIGGHTANVVWSSAELYNPQSGTFTLVNNMATVREAHTATLLNDGRVLIAGGWTGYYALRGAEIYNPATRTFNATGNMSYVRYVHTATLLPNGNVLIAAGSNGAFSNTGYKAEIYNPSTKSFSLTGNLNDNRCTHEAVLLPNGKVLVADGWEADSPGRGGHIRLAELFDASTGIFSTLNSGAAAGNKAVRLNNGTVLLAGGSSLIFDPINNTFAATTATMISPRIIGHTATLLANGSVLLTGGVTQNSTILTSAEIYFDTAAPSTLSLSGSATYNSTALPGVTLSLTGPTTATAVTDPTGAYTFPSIEDGAYTVTPSLAGYAFEPPNIAVTVSGGDVTGRNFTATQVDTDGDGLSDIDEWARGTNPNNADSDGDGVSDALEVEKGMNPLDSSDVTRLKAEIRDKIRNRLLQAMYYPPYLLDPENYGTFAALGFTWQSFSSWASQSGLNEKYEEYYWKAVEYDNLQHGLLSQAERLLNSGKVLEADDAVRASDKYAFMSSGYFSAASKVFDNALDIAEASAKAIEATSEFVVGAYTGPAVGLVYRAFHFGVDWYTLNLKTATKNAVIETLVDTIFKFPMSELGGKSIAEWAGSNAGKLLYPPLAQLTSDANVRKTISKLVKEYLVSQGISAYEGLADDLTNEFVSEIAKMSNSITVQLHSPCELRVFNQSNDLTGLAGGRVNLQIPRSIYNGEGVLIFSPEETFRYQVVGLRPGYYGIDVTNAENGITTTVSASQIPTTTNETHQYTVDWDVASQGGEGVSLAVDANGDGRIDREQLTGNTITTSDLYDIRPSAYPSLSLPTLNRLTNVTTITRRISIKNFGTGSISNVKATMSSIPAGVTVIDGSVSWAGTLAPGGEATGGDTFAYSYKRGTSVDLTAITWDFEFTDEHGVARVLRNVRQ